MSDKLHFAKLLCTALLCAPAFAQTYTVTPFGARCGGTLQGQVVNTPLGAGLRLRVAHASPNTVTVLVLGGLATAPQPLPGTNCMLLVDPRGTEATLTDGRGNAHFALRLPSTVPFTVHLQAATIDFNRRGRAVETTNGLQVDGF